MADQNEIACLQKEVADLPQGFNAAGGGAIVLFECYLRDASERFLTQSIACKHRVQLS
jgi:hypothetical protein